jgi:trk system potassium uptake protein TrkA
MTSDDRTNLVSSSLGKALGAKTTIVRVHDQTYSEHSKVNYQLHFGIDLLINPEALCAVELAKAIRNPGRLAVENFARGQIEVQQVRISGKSKLIGRTLKDLRLDPRVRIGYVQRNEKLQIADAETTLEESDLVTLVGPTEALFEIKPKFDPEAAKDLVRVVISGASETALVLLRLLSNPRFKVRILEANPRQCRVLAERYPQATVIHGSATSLRLLEEEQIGACDYFVGCTRDDEENVMTCLQAAKLGAKHVQLVINKPDYEAVLNNLSGTLGIQLTVSPRITTGNEVLRYISKEPYIELAALPGGEVRVVELLVAKDSPCVNKTIRDLPLPRGTVIVALQHKFQAKVPRAEDVLLAGDRVVVIVRQNQIKDVVNLLT